jgi:hypothetical protein
MKDGGTSFPVEGIFILMLYGRKILSTILWCKMGLRIKTERFKTPNTLNAIISKVF